jgi:hypothetical protein
MRELFTKYENKLAISEVAVTGSRPAALERFYLSEIATHLPKAKSPPFLGAFAICCQCLIDSFVNDFVFFKQFLLKELLQFFSEHAPHHFSSFPSTSSRGHFHSLSRSSYSPHQRWSHRRALFQSSFSTNYSTMADTNLALLEAFIVPFMQKRPDVKPGLIAFSPAVCISIFNTLIELHILTELPSSDLSDMTGAAGLVTHRDCGPLCHDVPLL